MADLRLVPEKKEGGKQFIVRFASENVSLFFFIIVLIVLGAVWGGLTLYRNSIDKGITDLESRIAALQEEIAAEGNASQQYVEFGKRLTTLTGNSNTPGLLDQHVSLRKVIEKVELIVHAQAQITNLSINAASRELTLAGHTPSYSIVAKQMKFLEGTLPFELKQVNLGSFDPTGGVQFSATLLIPSQLLYREW